MHTKTAIRRQPEEGLCISTRDMCTGIRAKQMEATARMVVNRGSIYGTSRSSIRRTSVIYDLQIEWNAED